MATAVLIDYLLLTKNDTSACVTRSKVQHAREKHRNTVNSLGDEPIKCIYIDGRKDETNKKSKDESGIMRYHTEKEVHQVLTKEPDGTYITHVSPSSGTAPCITDSIYEAMVQFGAHETLEVLGSDTTNTMSGVHRFIELRLNRNLFRVFCNLHTNELPLRHLFIQFDGKTSGKDSWTGPIGKTQKKFNH